MAPAAKDLIMGEFKQNKVNIIRTHFDTFHTAKLRKIRELCKFNLLIIK